MFFIFHKKKLSSPVTYSVAASLMAASLMAALATFFAFCKISFFAAFCKISKTKLAGWFAGWAFFSAWGWRGFKGFRAL